jgi:SAM-dependent methyltransferase
MTTFDDPAFFGDHWAALSDDLTAGPDPADAVAFLAGLAGPGARVLELAIGGGRVALPLAARGLRVEGVDGSPAVVERLRRTPGGADVPVVAADMADLPVTGPFDLAYVVWNSLFNVTDQDRQVATFGHVARVLRPGGLFVLECYVPAPERYGPQVRTRGLTEGSASFTLTTHDPVAQRIEMQHVTVESTGIRMLPVAHRYCWPAELDLMARLTGLRLRERHADWRRSPFGPDSTDHVSVYEKTGI